MSCYFLKHEESLQIIYRNWNKYVAIMKWDSLFAICDHSKMVFQKAVLSLASQKIIFKSFDKDPYQEQLIFISQYSVVQHHTHWATTTMNKFV